MEEVEYWKNYEVKEISFNYQKKEVETLDLKSIGYAYQYIVFNNSDSDNLRVNYLQREYILLPLTNVAVTGHPYLRNTSSIVLFSDGVKNATVLVSIIEKVK